MKNKITYDPSKLDEATAALVENLLKDKGAIEDPADQKIKKAWKPKSGEWFYYCQSNGLVDRDPVSEGSSWFNALYSIGNCFPTEESVRFAVERLKVIAELRRFAEEYNNAIDWSDPSSKKYMLYLDYSNNRVCSFDFTTTQFNDLVFSSEKIARAAIKTIGEDRLIKYYFGSYKEQE